MTTEVQDLRRVRVDKRDEAILIAVWQGCRTVREIAETAGPPSSSAVHERLRRLIQRGYVAVGPHAEATYRPGPRLAGLYRNLVTGARWPIEYVGYEREVQP